MGAHTRGIRGDGGTGESCGVGDGPGGSIPQHRNGRGTSGEGRRARSSMPATAPVGGYTSSRPFRSISTGKGKSVRMTWRCTETRGAGA
jgi:hypothetical protein